MLLTMIYRLLICIELLAAGSVLIAFVSCIPEMLKHYESINIGGSIGFLVGSLVAVMLVHFIITAPIKTKLNNAK